LSIIPTRILLPRGAGNLTAPSHISAGSSINRFSYSDGRPYYNLAHRDDDALIDDLAADGTAYVPFFPLGGFNPLQSATLSAVAARFGATPMQVALGWLLRRARNILLIPGTSSLMHLKENLAATEIALSDDVIKRRRNESRLTASKSTATCFVRKAVRPGGADAGSQLPQT
jgi:hypothetical protein